MSESQCPVCGWKLDADAKKLRLDGREVAICGDECAATLKANPKKYISVGGLA